VTFFGLTMVLVTHRAPSMDIALRVFRGMFNLPHSWHEALGPLAFGLTWLGVGFDGPPVSPHHVELVMWLIFWLSILWFLPNTQQLLARWHPAFNYGLVERQRDPPLLERSSPLARLLPGRLEWRPSAAGAIFVGLLAAAAILNLHHVSEFLYFRY
jgi:alginate O-acetyltransferase complex protein AlgI